MVEKQKNWFRRHPVWTGIIGVFILLFLIGMFFGGGEDDYESTEQKPSKKIASIPGYDKSLVRNYEMVETEDISIRAMDKPLSSYSATEINELPINIRKSYRIIIPSDISKDELKSTLIQVVLDKTSLDSDIDEIVVYAYDTKEDIDNAHASYTFGKVEWCPNGNWAGVTERIASTNDRSSYKYVFNLKEEIWEPKSYNLDVERKVSILAEKEKIEFCSSINGVLVLVGVYDKEGNCAWINGHAKVILKDSSGNIIETKEKDLREKDILLGSDCMGDFPDIVINNIDNLNKINSATLEYTTEDGEKYTSSEAVTDAFDYCY